MRTENSKPLTITEYKLSQNSNARVAADRQTARHTTVLSA